MIVAMQFLGLVYYVTVYYEITKKTLMEILKFFSSCCINGFLIFHERKIDIKSVGLRPISHDSSFTCLVFLKERKNTN